MARRIEYTAGDFVGDHGLIFIEDLGTKRLNGSGQYKTFGLYLCHCNKAFESANANVRSGNTKGCEECKKTHGLTNHYLYNTWNIMIQRCHNPSFTKFSTHGGRGIKVCEEWRHSPVKFLEFCDAVLGKRPEGHTLDRIDNDGNYEPSNVRWASVKVQNNNRRNSK